MQLRRPQYGIWPWALAVNCRVDCQVLIVGLMVQVDASHDRQVIVMVLFATGRFNCRLILLNRVS